MELVLLCAEQEAEAGAAEGANDAASVSMAGGSSKAPSSSSDAALEALAAAWSAAEAAFPHLTGTLVPHASKLSLDQLAGALLQRFVGQQRLTVNLQVGVCSL